MTSGSFRPISVLELDLDATDPTAIDPGDSAWVIARMHGAAIGVVELPDSERGYSPSELRRTVIDTVQLDLVDHLIVSALESGLALTDLVPADLVQSRVPRAVPLPSLTVAVCTRDRTEDLTRCLQSLQQVDYPDLDVLVVDNAPPSDATEELVRRTYPHVRYVREMRPGLSWARRRALASTDRDVVSFVDDDVVVDSGWARAVGTLMSANRDVMVVTGLVMPFELEHEAQLAFERHGGFGRGFDRRWLRPPSGTPAAWNFAHVGRFGTGANMSIRRELFDVIESFDVALGAGTATTGGEDLDVLFRTMKAGYTLAYEPRAMVRHRHRTNADALTGQFESWGLGMHAYLARAMAEFPDERLALRWLEAQLLFLHYPVRIVQALVDPRLAVAPRLAQLRGALQSRSRYREARRRAAELAATADSTGPRSAISGPPRVARAMRVVDVDLGQPLPETLDGPNDADEVTIVMWIGSERVGSASLSTGGYPVCRSRIADAVVASLPGRTLDACGLQVKSVVDAVHALA